MGPGVRAPVRGLRRILRVAARLRSLASWLLLLARHVLGALLRPTCLSCGEGLPSSPRALPLCDACSSVLSRAPLDACPACGAPAPTPDARCGACADVALPYRRVHALLEYGGPASDLVLRLKYGRAFAVARPLGRALAAVVAARDPAVADAVVVPVPLDRPRLASRGYNQAALLGRVVARALGLPFRPDALQRAVARDKDAPLDRTGRRRRVRGAFAILRPADVRGRVILLVDDVVTTGATAGECARVLCEAGASRVDVACVCRVARDALSENGP